MSLFWKRKSVAPSTDSTTAILDAHISPDEASSLNSHPILAAASSSRTSSLQSHTPTEQKGSLIDFSDNLSTVYTTSKADMTTAATLGETIHLALDGAPRSPVESEKAQLTPTSQKRRSFFNFGKKKSATEEANPKPPTSIPPITTTAAPLELKSHDTTATGSPTSPVRSSHFGSQRGLSKTSSSPRLSTSSIFERNVQDPSVLPPSSPAIPSHFSTDNYIPPALDATSLAITDRNVDPDSVEIVRTTAHHPVLAQAEAYSNPWAEDVGNHSGDESIGHGYSSSLASADKRRLSFISFADVVHAENEEASHSTTNLDIFSGKQPESSLRSQSPVRTPPNPPHSPPGTGLGLSDFSMEKDMSIPAPNHHAPHSEVTVETLSQALRRHGSTDLRAAAMRSQSNSFSTEDHETNPWKDN